MSGVKWETGGFRDPIIKVECVSETSLFVVIKRNGILDDELYEERLKKRGSYKQFHDSWDEAHLYLVTTHENNVAALRAQLVRAKSVLGNIKGMKKPSEVTK